MNVTSTGDRRGYDSYRTRCQLWIDCLNSDDRHGVWRRIWDMTFMTSCFEMARSAVSLSPRGTEGPEFNGPLWLLIKNTFFESMVARVRALVDEAFPLDGPKGVYSLGSLLVDMRGNVHLLTRGNMESFSKERGKQQWWIDEVHGFYDQLCSVDEEARSSDDCIPQAFIEFLQVKTRVASSSIKDFATKFVAHTSSPESRIPIEDVEITLEDLFTAHRSLAEVAELVSVWLVEGVSHSAAGLADNQFAFLDRPLVLTDEALFQVKQAVDDYTRTIKHSAWTMEQALEEYRLQSA